MADWNWNDPALRAVLSLRAGVVGIDGRCGSGKTTLAAALAARLPCRVLHTDDFYLSPAGRRADWQQVPAANMGDINSELSKRRGRMLGMNPAEDGLQEIEAEVPMSEMFDFPTALRSITQGRGSFTLTFAHYEQLPKEKEAEVIAEAKSMMEEE